MMPSQTAMSRLGRRLALVAGAAALLGAASAVRADDVYWSVGVHSPGVSVGVSNAPPPRVYYPRPVVVYPQPVYAQPIYHPRPVVVYPPAVHPGWGPPPHHWKKAKAQRHHGHGNRWGRDDDDRGRDHRRGWDDDDRDHRHRR